MDTCFRWVEFDSDTIEEITRNHVYQQMEDASAKEASGTEMWEWSDRGQSDAPSARRRLELLSQKSTDSEHYRETGEDRAMYAPTRDLSHSASDADDDEPGSHEGPSPSILFGVRPTDVEMVEQLGSVSCSTVARVPTSRKRTHSDASTVSFEVTEVNKPANKASKVTAKNWCFTVNNPKYYDFDTIVHHDGPNSALDNVQYCIAGQELGQEQTEHIQGYVQFSKRVAFNTACKILELMWGRKPHVERQKSKSNKAAREYCLKDGVYKEFGNFTDNCKGRKTPKGITVKQERQGIYKALQTGTTIKQAIDTNPEEVMFIERCSKYLPSRDTEAKMLFLHGKTGVGKTFSTNKVLQAAGIPYLKIQNGTLPPRITGRNFSAPYNRNPRPHVVLD